MRHLLYIAFFVVTLTCPSQILGFIFAPTLEQSYLKLVQEHQQTHSRNKAYRETWSTAQEVFDIVDSTPQSELLSIVRECQDVSGPLSEQCLESLSTIYMKYPANVHIWNNAYFDPLYLVDRLTFEDILQNPDEDLRLVRSALLADECKLKSNEVRPELAEKCHADSFMRVHFIQLNCEIFDDIHESLPEYFHIPSELMNSLFRSTLEGTMRDGDNQAQAAKKDSEAFLDARKRDRLWDVLLQSQWVRHQCNKLDKSGIELLSEEYRGTYFARRVEPLKIAASYGDEFAQLHQLLATNSSFSSVVDYQVKHHSWLVKYNELARNYVIEAWDEDSDLFLYSYEQYQSQLVQYIDTMNEAKIRGWDFDLKAFTLDFCSPFSVEVFGRNLRNIEWPGDCSWLVYGIRKSKTITDYDKLNLLNEFEQVASQLGVYRRENFAKADDVFSLPELSEDREYERVVAMEPVRIARDRKVEGWVDVSFTITESGSVTDVTIVDSEPENVFDQVAMDAASMFRYKPRIRDNRLVRVEEVRHKFKFHRIDDQEESQND